MNKIQAYVAQHESRFLEELFQLIRIPSISAKSEHKADMLKTAEYWKELLLQTGCQQASIFPTAGNPIVYAERIIDPNKKTVLVYGHYDVMPPEPLELWNHDPFDPIIKDGRIWARGADDDKGQAMIQAKGFETALQLGLVDVNVKFILEGEEEIGSTHLAGFMEEQKELLQADVILVSDTSMVSEEVPSLTTGLRGLCYWEIEVTGPNRDLHSGHFGGAVANPINELCKLLAKMVDDKGRITIPHFYDRVVPLSDVERNMIAQVPFSEEKYCQALDIAATQGEEGYSTLERNSCRPSFDICGIWGGYTGEGAKTVLPSKAYAKVSTRLVADQDYHEISEQFVKYVESLTPKSVKIKVTPHHGGEAYLCPIDLPAYQAAEQAVADGFGVRPLAIRRGGSIPIIPTFERVLGIKTVLMGFGLERNAIHSPNESFSLDYFRKGIASVAKFYELFR